MRVAVIVLDWFGAETTRRCLRSLQGEPIECCYVVDNSADDEAHRRLRQMLDEVAAQWPGVSLELLRAPRNLGFAAGVGFALEHDRASPSPHEFYVLVNNDAQAHAGLVGALVAAADGPRRLLGACVEDGAGGVQRERWYQRWLALNARDRRAGFVPYLSGCCLGVSADLANRHGLFDPAFFMYGEDVELSWRLRRAGVALQCVSDARVTHPSRERRGLFYEYHVARGHLLLGLRLWRLRAEVPLLLLARVPVLALRALWRAVRQRSAVPLLALLLAPLPLRVLPSRKERR